MFWGEEMNKKEKMISMVNAALLGFFLSASSYLIDRTALQLVYAFTIILADAGLMLMLFQVEIKAYPLLRDIWLGEAFFFGSDFCFEKLLGLTRYWINMVWTILGVTALIATHAVYIYFYHKISKESKRKEMAMEEENGQRVI